MRVTKINKKMAQKKLQAVPVQQLEGVVEVGGGAGGGVGEELLVQLEARKLTINLLLLHLWHHQVNERHVSRVIVTCTVAATPIQLSLASTAKTTPAKNQVRSCVNMKLCIIF